MTRKTVKGIEQWLMEKIRQQWLRGDYRLASIRALAGEAGCSPVTMQKVVHVLHQQHIVKPVAHSGTRILKHPDDQHSHARIGINRISAQKRSSLLKQQLLQAMSQGTFLPGTT